VQPDRVGFTFLADGETDEQHLAYGELDRRARALAARLQQEGRAGDRVLLLFDPGLDYLVAFFAAVYAGRVPVPAYPPDLMRADRTLPRLRALVDDCRPEAVLGTRPSLAAGGLFSGSAARTIAAEDWGQWERLTWADPDLRAGDVAFLQYTSGSTSSPRGVIVSHRNLLYQLARLHHRWEQSSPSGEEYTAGVSWLPFYHDLGLIAAVLTPFYSGQRIVTMSPLAFMQRPIRWLRAVARYRAVATGGPNFAYDLCVSKFRPVDAEGLDLRCWRIAVSGAEPIRSETLERFTRTFAPYGFSPSCWAPSYGLAEATLGVTAYEACIPFVEQDFSAAALEVNKARLAALGTVGGASDGRVRRLVGCGKALAGTEVVIAAPDTGERLGPDAVGEVWVRGPGVALGYWNRPEETVCTFQARLADGEGPFLRTGDLGFFHDGLLYLTGRLKEMMIFCGRNIYPQDVEQTVCACHPALRANGGAAFAVEGEEGERLVVVQEARGQFDLPALAAAVRQAILAEHRVPLHALALTRPGSLPKTSSGKIQRREARRRFLEGELNVLQQMTFDPMGGAVPLAATRTEEAVLGWLRTRLARACGVPEEEIARDEPLARYAVDSVSLVALGRELERWLGRPVSLEVLFEAPTLMALARRLAEPTTPAALVVDTLSEDLLNQALARLLSETAGREVAPRGPDLA
jgi:acyl-CoA synthetase (AMP-forming)/AMP-acid ligase II/aryl carrier-like protein